MAGGELAAGNGALKDAGVASLGNCARGFCVMLRFKGLFRCGFLSLFGREKKGGGF